LAQAILADGSAHSRSSLMSEFAKANREVERFLGVSWGQLCPQFGFNHNPQHLLICEVITSFLTFHFLLCVAGWISAQFLEERGSADQRGPTRDTSLEELDNFSTLVDQTLTSISQVESSAASQAAPSGSGHGRPRDIEQLKEEFQGRIAAVKSKWQQEPDPPGDTDDVDEFHVTAALVVLYFALQAILSCMVTCSVGISTTRVADGSIWAHYCLLMYAVSNSGTLPTGCLALAFLSDWFLFEGVTTFPVHELGPLDPSYQPISQAPEAGPGRPARRSAADVLRHQEEVADMKPKFVLLCLPELAPLVFMVVTHTIPFVFMFLWLSILMAIASVVVIELVRLAVKRLTPTPRLRILRQTQFLMFLVYAFATMYIHTSVQVMTRVYAGEWRHGGSFDSLWWHLIVDSDKLAQCPWFSLVRVVDLPLRWL